MVTLPGALIYRGIIYAFLSFVNRKFTKNYKKNYSTITVTADIIAIRNLSHWSARFSPAKKYHFITVTPIIKNFITWNVISSPAGNNC